LHPTSVMSAFASRRRYHGVPSFLGGPGPPRSTTVDRSFPMMRYKNREVPISQIKRDPSERVPQATQMPIHPMMYSLRRLDCKYNRCFMIFI